jgi:hypothetical protein
MTASILAALLVLAPITTEAGKFTIRQDGRTIGTEEFSIRAKDKGYIAEGKTQLVGDPAPLTSKMELDQNLNVISYEYTHGPAKIRIKVKDPLESSEISLGDQAGDSSTEFRFPDRGIILDNNFFHHYLILLYKVTGADQRFGVFVPQDMQVGQARIRSTGKGTYTLELGDLTLDATVDASGRMTRLSLPSARVIVER